MSALADVVLVLHALVVMFIVGGFGAVWLGAPLHWAWVRARPWRLAHLVAVGIVALLAALDVPCPLTALENRLRTGTVGPEGFIQHGVGRLLYYALPGWVFTVAYILFALAVLLTWRYVPPEPPRPR